MARSYTVWLVISWAHFSIDIRSSFFSSFFVWLRSEEEKKPWKTRQNATNPIYVNRSFSFLFFISNTKFRKSVKSKWRRKIETTIINKWTASAVVRLQTKKSLKFSFSLDYQWVRYNLINLRIDNNPSPKESDLTEKGTLSSQGCYYFYTSEIWNWICTLMILGWSTKKILFAALIALCILGIILAIVFFVLGKKKPRSPATGTSTTTKNVVTKGVSPDQKYQPVPNVWRKKSFFFRHLLLILFFSKILSQFSSSSSRFVFFNQRAFFFSHVCVCVCLA